VDWESPIQANARSWPNLRSQTVAFAKPATKLLLVEFILNESNKSQFAKMTDLEMLVISSYGRERIRVEWENLLRASGFQLTRTIPTKSGVSVIDAVRDQIQWADQATR
jgi:hypothetical protein